MSQHLTDTQNQDYRVVPIEGKAQRKTFVKVPWTIYANDPNWVPPLLIERESHVDPKQNPYFEHGEAQLWIAYRGDTPVGRISAQIDQASLARHKNEAGHFGFIEGIDDPKLFKQLLDTAESWLKERGMKRAQGPFSFSMFEEPGLLVDGFDRPPTMLMGHTRPYYATHIEAAGYHKAIDTVSYDFDVNAHGLSDRSKALVQRLYDNPRVTIRNLNSKDFKNELESVLDVYNDAWSDNWGFVPLSPKETEKLASDLRPLIKARHFCIIEVDGEVAAFGLTLPNLNEAIRDLNGRLFPFGWTKLAYRLLANKVKTARLPLMGVRQKHQKSWMGAAMCLAIIDMVHSRNVGEKDQAELGWVLETNVGVRKIIESTGCKPYKTYRVFEKELG